MATPGSTPLGVVCRADQRPHRFAEWRAARRPAAVALDDAFLSTTTWWRLGAGRRRSRTHPRGGPC